MPKIVSLIFCRTKHSSHHYMCENKTELITDISVHDVMPCNTQRAAKKQDFIFLPSWAAFWVKEQAQFVSMKHFKCPSNNLETVKGFYLLSLKHLFSVEKKMTLTRKQGHLPGHKHQPEARKRSLKAHPHLGDPWGLDTGLAVEDRFCSMRW